jgi:hypothetical protein
MKTETINNEIFIKVIVACVVGFVTMFALFVVFVHGGNIN